MIRPPPQLTRVTASGAAAPGSASGIEASQAITEARLARLQRQFRLHHHISRSLLRPQNESQLLTQVCRALVEVGGYRYAWIGLPSTEAGAGLQVAASALMPAVGSESAAVPARGVSTGDQTPAARAFAEHTAQIVHSMDDVRWDANWRMQAQQCGYAGALAIPLLAGADCAGVLELYSNQFGGFDPSELALLNDLGHDLAFALATLRAHAREQRQHTEFELVARALRMQSAVNAAVLRIRDRDELLKEACRIGTRIGRYTGAVIWMVEPGQRELRRAYWSGDHFPYRAADRLPFGDGSPHDPSLTSRALRSGEIGLCQDLTRSDAAVFDRDTLLSYGLKGLIVLPILVDQVPVGALTLWSAEPLRVREEELLLLQDIAASLAFGLRSQQTATAAEFLAHFDPLTGLALRSMFCRRSDQFLRAQLDAGQAPTVAALDVDRLSNFNDTFGRHFGDLLLQQIADRLRRHAGCDERVGYLGGGTFVLLEPTVSASDRHLSSELDEMVFSAPFEVEGRSVRVSCHSGVARHRIDGEDGCALVQKAEAALKHAKTTGEQYLHYKLEMRSEIAERLTLEHKLREALEQRQFELFYQPQINVVTGHIESLEALLRWRDPEEGLILPGRFLPVLESSGLIMPVGKWVIEQALQDCERWRRQGLRPVRVAVNVSPLQIRRREFTDYMLELARARTQEISGFGIDLEITESALLQDLESTGRRLRELRAAGYRIALDDFGTGYSSLGLLSKLPVDLLKIDRSFVMGLPLDAICMTLTRSIIGLASAFGLVAVAEGVETAEQLKLLRLLNCDQSQGYFHSPPVPVDQIDRLLAQDQ